MSAYKRKEAAPIAREASANVGAASSLCRYSQNIAILKTKLSSDFFRYDTSRLEPTSLAPDTSGSRDA